jgi:hypothetical protein
VNTIVVAVGTEPERPAPRRDVEHDSNGPRARHRLLARQPEARGHEAGGLPRPAGVHHLRRGGQHQARDRQHDRQPHHQLHTRHPIFSSARAGATAIVRAHSPLRGLGGRDGEQILQLQERLLTHTLDVHELLDLISEDGFSTPSSGPDNQAMLDELKKEVEAPADAPQITVTSWIPCIW